jgi:hypothetical protein
MAARYTAVLAAYRAKMGTALTVSKTDRIAFGRPLSWGVEAFVA